MLPLWFQAGLWGLLAGSGLVIGAAIAHFVELPHRLIAAVMGFGGGVLIAVLAIDLAVDAFESGGILPTVGGFLLGATIFSGVNWRLAAHGAQHRNRCGGCVQQPSEADMPGSGVAIAVGAVLDGVPESMVIGLSLVNGGTVGIGLVAGFFLANVPQGLSSAAGMKRAGRSATYIFTVWSGIAVISGIAATAGNLVLQDVGPLLPAAVLAFAAGGVLAMLAEAMIPEAFENAQPFIGLVTAIGFVAAFLFIELLG